MADSDLLKAQKEAAKKAQEDTNRQLAAINKLIDGNKGEAKDRVKLLKMQDDLKKTQQTLSGDLGKNISDMKDGFANTVNGMVNQTFGPLGGMVTSLTTGFFKRGKENRENLTQNEMQNDNAKEMIVKLGGIQEAVEGVDKKTLAPDKDIDNKKAAANGGEVVAGEEESKGFGIMLLRFLGMVGAAIAGLAAGAAVGVVGYLTGWVKLLGKTITGLISKIPTPKWLDEVIDALKNFGGKAFTRIKNFFVGETSVFKRIGKTLDTVTDAVKGFTGGVFGRISKFFTGEASVFKRIGTIVDTVTDSVKGFTGGIFTRIGTFFKNIQPKWLTDIIDASSDALKSFKGAKGAAGGGIFSKIGGVFKSLGGIGDTLMAPIKAVMDFFPGGGAKGGGGIISKVLKFLLPFGDVFRNFAKLGAKLIAPLNIIIGIFDAGFEAKDAYDKSDGFFATLFNGIIGAIGGFIDGAILSLLDLVKDGVAWVAGALGFKDVEKKLDSFSFSKIFNEWLDDVYAFINKLFNNPLEMLRGVANSILGETITTKLFGDSPEAQAAELKKQFEEQRKELSEMKQKTSVTGAKTGIGAESDLSFKKRVSAETAEMNILAGKMKDLEEKYGKDVFKGTAARGGFIVNQPTYLPNSGVVVGEHGTYSGGAAYGGIADGGPEAVIPLSSSRAGAFIDPMARSVAGQVINQLAMERIGMGADGGGGATVVTDARSSQTNNNTTVINNPSPIGQTLPDEGRDFVSKVA